ncbi:hypothetical protein M3196_18790 [Fictibacillus nanhaiensis]|uniref:hypothetical protein n=1 Tax=Fictibacillus nanhaiensis TaxID=742169 RepID=UPI00203F356F|nr:hypothetical protein [Fictibacillus nanhaiensis]MCM3733701.1 hypothetical protein [Fictibacillus nanhaiensis]
MARQNRTFVTEKDAFLKEGEVLFLIELKESSVGKKEDSFMPIIKDIQLLSPKNKERNWPLFHERSAEEFNWVNGIHN